MTFAVAVYFMQSADGGPVKIGHSTDVERRREQLSSHYGRPLIVLATMPGGPEEEAEIHGRFHHLRLKGKGTRGRYPEQFRPESELMAFIGRPLLAGANPDAVEVMEPNRTESGTLSVKLHLDVIEAARIVAAYSNVTITDLLSDILRPILDEMEDEAIQRRIASRPECG